jgi:hypothetical protein
MGLVRIPNETNAFCDSATLTRYNRACEIAGHRIDVNSSYASILRGPADGAWRPYAEQARLYALFLAGKGNTASDPDKGQRNHMRGAALDIGNRADRQAMLDAGFLPDPGEWWHFNDPNWARMPIIKTLPAGLDISPIGEDDMGAIEQKALANIEDKINILVAEQRGYGGRTEDIQGRVIALPREMALELTERTILVGPDGQPAQFRAVLEQAARNANGSAPITIDRDALTAALAPTVAETLREVLGADLPDDIAEKTADVLARRLAGA